MRVSILPALATAAVLAGCVAVPPTGPVVTTPTAPVITAPAQPSNAVARQVVSSEMARRLPGRNVGPLTDCVMQNATMAELADIASLQGQSGAAGAVAAIVSRPATAQCIQRAAVA